MKLKLDKIRPNPFRDFDLYPIDEEQVLRLQQSMNSLGFFSGVTARKASGGGFELAAGHHRIAAADREDLMSVEAVVEPYTDRQMVEIMMVENMTQRGHNAASVLIWSQPTAGSSPRRCCWVREQPPKSWRLLARTSCPLRRPRLPRMDRVTACSIER